MNFLKKLYTTLLFLMCVHLLNAQEMSVELFYHDETDLTALRHDTKKQDQNGNLCALIKVETTAKDLTFEVGVLGVVAIVEQPAEVWVYVPYGIRKISIMHPRFGMVRNYPLPIAIEQGRTYILKLSTPAVSDFDTGGYDHTKKQDVRFKVFPADANVDVNGMSIPLDANGVHQQKFSFGRYQVMVSAPKYHPERRRMEIKDSSNVLDMNIHLKQAFGWMKLNGDGDEKLFIDEKPFTIVPGEQIELMSGHYKIRLEKPLYKPYDGAVEIMDSVVYDFAPQLVENFREMTLRVNNDAEIWVDSVKVGTGSWTGKLEYGTYRVEARKESHRTSVKLLDVNEQTMAFAPVLLDSPEPIFGDIDVTTNPIGAQVYVDDKLVGYSPMTVHALVGQRKVTIKRDGYNTENRTVNVAESQTTRLDLKLSNIVSMTVSSSPRARLYVDGDFVGKTPAGRSVIAGNHTVRLEADNYKSLEKEVFVDERNKTFSFSLKRRLYLKSAFVFGGSALTGFSDVALGGYMGAYIKNFYFEGFGQKGLGSSEVIYWNSLEGDLKPLEYTYSPLFVGGKVGWGFILGTRMKVTPMLGCGVIRLMGEQLDGRISSFDPSGCASVAAIGALKVGLALTPFMELNVAPEYYYSVSKTDIYNVLYNVSPTVVGWSEGVKLNLGLGFFF